MGRACIHSPRELYLEGQTVVEIGEGNAVLRTHWLSNDDLVDIIELIPILVPGETTSTLISTLINTLISIPPTNYLKIQFINVFSNKIYLPFQVDSSLRLIRVMFHSEYYKAFASVQNHN